MSLKTVTHAHLVAFNTFKNNAHLPDIQMRGTRSACVLVLFSEQLPQLDVESSSNVTDGEAIVRPLAAALHVADHCKTR